MLINLLYIVIAILLLCFIILFHELGHYIAGRLCGIGIVEFAIGFGPKIAHWERKGIQYSIRALPLGGFCQFVGEDEANAAPNAMNRQPVWKRLINVLAGPAMNLVLAFLAGIILYLGFAIHIYPQVDSLVADMPAAESQLEVGDVIIAANGTEIPFDDTGTETLRAIIQQSDSVELTVRRGGETLTVTVEPVVVENAVASGESVRQVGMTFHSGGYSLGESIAASGRLFAEVSTLMYDVLSDLIFRGEGADQVTGVVGTVAVANQMLQLDASMIPYFVVIISLNLGIINLLPLPALDGGRLVFLIVEAIRRKPVPPEKEGMVHGIGMLLFFGLFIVLTWHDIVTYVL